MRHFDLSPLYRSTIGFDGVFSMLDKLTGVDGASGGYPPYNIERTGDNAYRISIAVAGFSGDDLTVEMNGNTLTVRGEKTTKTEDKAREYLHQGIASRAFERKFQVADHVNVTGARLDNGLLHIDLVREIPEAEKPRLIPIATGGAAGQKEAVQEVEATPAATQH
ncbi:Hsp20 family protein [Camelimonas abortus]|uniref:Hsp20 family protein n=1 Tax=Camelimonas abortus TaxID=1017184 RepID=A0ABV7LEP3_9HYPH